MVIATWKTKSNDLIEVWITFVDDSAYWKVIINRKECYITKPTSEIAFDEITAKFSWTDSVRNSIVLIS